MLTPGSALPSRFMTLPRITETVRGSIAPAATPVWIAVLPEYRNCVAAAKSVATVGSSGGARVEGSGGIPGGGGGPAGTTTLAGWLRLPAASVSTIVSVSPPDAAIAAVKLPSAATVTETTCPVRTSETEAAAPASAAPGLALTVTWPLTTALTMTRPGSTGFGGMLSRVTLMVICEALPARSVAETVIG